MSSELDRSAPMATVVRGVAATPSAGKLAYGGLICLIIAFWMIIHPFRGIEHDSVLYAVLALARLHPAALGHDMFVRFGTQDKFTIFSPVFAYAIRTVGLERAAAVMTFATHAVFFGAAWLLARRFMSRGQALLAVGLLVVVPSWYGGGSVFAAVEAFLTPRQSAEAFALAGIAAALCSRHWIAGLCMAAALLLHPIIAAAGITLWIIMFPAWARPRLAAGIVLAAAVVLVGLSAAGVGPLKHFDAAWLGILRGRLTYLYPTLWPWTDWINTAVRIASLLVGALLSRHEGVRRLCIATLITTVMGMSFAMVESDWLNVVVAAQLQTWRWLWLPGVLAVLLAPSIALDCWRSEAGAAGRAAALLLLGAWIINGDEFAIVPALLACICAAANSRLRDPRLGRLILFGSWVVLAVSAVILAGRLRDLLPQLQTIRAGHRPYLVRIEELQALAYAGLLPAAMLAVTWWMLERGTPRGALLLTGLGAALLLSVAPYSLRTWTQQQRYSAQRYDAFAAWRAVIPESAEILWPDPPQVAWFNLGRSSYWSLYQMAGLVFSREVTMISSEREKVSTPVLPQLGRIIVTGTPSHTATPRAGNARSARAGPCSVPDVTFYASWIDRGPTPYPPVAADPAKPQQLLYLYRCDGAGHL